VSIPRADQRQQRHPGTCNVGGHGICGGMVGADKSSVTPTRIRWSLLPAGRRLNWTNPAEVNWYARVSFSLRSSVHTAQTAAGCRAAANRVNMKVPTDDRMSAAAAAAASATGRQHRADNQDQDRAHAAQRDPGGGHHGHTRSRRQGESTRGWWWWRWPTQRTPTTRTPTTRTRHLGHAWDVVPRVSHAAVATRSVPRPLQLRLGVCHPHPHAPRATRCLTIGMNVWVSGETYSLQHHGQDGRC
jgi:hypothetical protein